MQTSFEGLQEFEFDKINPAMVVEAVGYFDSAALVVKLSLITCGKDDMVESGLHLHPVSACFATVIAFYARQDRFVDTGAKPTLNLAQSAEVIARRRKIILKEELLGGEDFSIADRGTDVNPVFQPLD